MDTQRRISIDLLSIEEAERFLTERVTLAVQSDLPPVLTEPADLWQCDYCPARTECEHIHGGPVGKAAQTKNHSDTEEV
jgi:hypothetical protein